MMRDLSLHLLDILQNSVVAEAKTIEIHLYITNGGDELIFAVIDDGTGMSDEMVKTVVDPFVTGRTTRRVGLGIPFIKEAAEITGGRFDLQSEQGKGTELTAVFKVDNIDRLPIGDIAESIVSNILGYPDIEHILEIRSAKGVFLVSTKEIKSELGDVPITEISVLSWIKEYINESINNLFGGILNEIVS